MNLCVWTAMFLYVVVSPHGSGIQQPWLFTRMHAHMRTCTLRSPDLVLGARGHGYHDTDAAIRKLTSYAYRTVAA